MSIQQGFLSPNPTYGVGTVVAMTLSITKQLEAKTIAVTIVQCKKEGFKTQRIQEYEEKRSYSLRQRERLQLQATLSCGGRACSLPGGGSIATLACPCSSLTHE